MKRRIWAMSRKLEYDIKEKYGYELNEISNKLNQLEAGSIYENGGSKWTEVWLQI